MPPPLGFPCPRHGVPSPSATRHRVPVPHTHGEVGAGDGDSGLQPQGQVGQRRGRVEAELGSVQGQGAGLGQELLWQHTANTASAHVWGQVTPSTRSQDPPHMRVPVPVPGPAVPRCGCWGQRRPGRCGHRGSCWGSWAPTRGRCCKLTTLRDTACHTRARGHRGTPCVTHRHRGTPCVTHTDTAGHRVSHTDTGTDTPPHAHASATPAPAAARGSGEPPGDLGTPRQAARPTREPSPCPQACPRRTGDLDVALAEGAEHGAVAAPQEGAASPFRHLLLQPRPHLQVGLRGWGPQTCHPKRVTVTPCGCATPPRPHPPVFRRGKSSRPS